MIAINKKVVSSIKKIPILKKRRVRKRLKYYVYKYMLSKHEVRLGEKDFIQKQKLVTRQINRYPIKASELRCKIDKIYTNEKKLDDKDSLLIDIFFSFYAYGYSPYEYVCYDFINKSIEERRKFISDRESVCYGYRMNDIDSMSLFMNKMKTYEMYKEYYKREAISISKLCDKKKFFDFVSKHSRFVKKEVNESCGRGVELIELNKINTNLESLFERLIAKGEVILEECVIQGMILSKLNDTSVNTVRCITLNTKNGVVVPFCFLKIGRAGAFIDNGGAGGILVGINNETGILETDGVDELNNRYIVHPDSGVRFIGFQLPEWNTLKSLCVEMSSKSPNVKCIGWDMAYTSEGWVVIEGNGLTEVIGPQAPYLRGIRDEWEKYMNSIELIF